MREGGREGGRERRERNVNERGFNPISHVIFMASNFVRKEMWQSDMQHDQSIIQNFLLSREPVLLVVVLCCIGGRM